MQAELPEQQFNTWIRPLQAVDEGSVLRLLAPNRFVIDWVRQNYLDRILEVVDDTGGNVEVVVEVPMGSRNKYELDKERGVFVLDRMLFSAVHYPGDYGFVAVGHHGRGDIRQRDACAFRADEDGNLVWARTYGEVREQDIEQRWFPGVHSDVGGGYPENESGLSKIALVWLLDECEKAGLKLNRPKCSPICQSILGNH